MGLRKECVYAWVWGCSDVWGRATCLLHPMRVGGWVRVTSPSPTALETISHCA
jgi:hypothetical protein